MNLFEAENSWSLKLERSIAQYFSVYEANSEISFFVRLLRQPMYFSIAHLYDTPSSEQYMQLSHVFKQTLEYYKETMKFSLCVSQDILASYSDVSVPYYGFLEDSINSHFSTHHAE